MEAPISSPSHSTFRDPAGSVEIKSDGAYRTVSPAYASEILEFLSSPLAARLVAEGRLVASEVLSPGRDEDEVLLLRHPRVTFVSYPAEWSPALWLSAAELTLTLCAELVQHGWILKDATPLNILFEGTRPVFVDVLSIQRADLSRPIWLAYAQFVRTFLLPMLAHSQLGWPLHAVLSRRDGFEPEEVYTALPWTRRLTRPALTSVTLPRLLMKRSGSGKLGVKKISDADLTRQILGNTLAGLRTAMRKSMPLQQSSVWSSYVETACHYSAADHAEKQRFLASAFEQHAPRRVLDVGCNTGAYSRLAAAVGAEVVSIDADSNAVDRLCHQLRGTNQHVLPLCVDFAHPTPATGWDNRETASFLQRSENYFDTVLMLAVLHHLLISSQVPLGHIAALCSRITNGSLFIEWVPPTDGKFIEVLRGREELYRHITESSFRCAFAVYFNTVQEQTLANGRIMLHLRKK